MVCKKRLKKQKAGKNKFTKKVNGKRSAKEGFKKRKGEGLAKTGLKKNRGKEHTKQV